jgi:PKD repeat protein
MVHLIGLRKTSFIALAIAFSIISILLLSKVPATEVTNANLSTLNPNSWPAFHHDEAHTGYSTSEGPTSNKTLWVFATGGSVETSPAVADGKVYFGSDD